MSNHFRYANIVAGALIFIIGFCTHWLGPLISVLNWDLAIRLSLQEKKMLLECKVYEHAIAIADTAIGWLYGVAAIDLFSMWNGDTNLRGFQAQSCCTMPLAHGHGRQIAGRRGTNFDQTLYESDGVHSTP